MKTPQLTPPTQCGEDPDNFLAPDHDHRSFMNRLLRVHVLFEHPTEPYRSNRFQEASHKGRVASAHMSSKKLQTASRQQHSGERKIVSEGGHEH